MGHGWDAESSHRLATGGHADAAATGNTTDRIEEVSGWAAHQLFAESTGPESVHDGQHGAETGSAAAHVGPAHLHVTGTESPGDDGSGHDGSGYDAFGHGGSGYDYHDAADQHMHAGHEDAWVHEAGHTDAAFGGDDGGPSSFHDGAS